MSQNIDGLMGPSYFQWKSKEPGLYIEPASAEYKLKCLKKSLEAKGVDTTKMKGINPKSDPHRNDWDLMWYHEEGYNTLFRGTLAECQEQAKEYDCPLKGVIEV